jgi:hypothetical protein
MSAWRLGHVGCTRAARGDGARTFLITNPVSSRSQSFIVGSMSSSNRRGVWASLLCALLFWLTVNPPHCDLCDGISVTIASAYQPVLKHYHSVAPDRCNGICTCCGFYGLPNAGQVLVPVNAVLADIVPEPPHPAFAPRSTIYRPPRVAAS